MGERRPVSDGISIAEYLRAEARRQIRHEYVRGEVYAMSGGTARHSQIAANIIARLQVAARGAGCIVYTSDFKVQPSDEAVYYPDVSVICGAQDGSAILTTAPCLVVEVTSRSTARIDRGEKVDEYCKAASLRGYLIVDQNFRRVTCYTRDADGAWAHAELTESGTIAIPCPKTALTLDQIYEDVSMPPFGVAEPDVDEATGEYVMAKD